MNSFVSDRFLRTTELDLRLFTYTFEEDSCGTFTLYSESLLFQIFNNVVQVWIVKGFTSLFESTDIEDIVDLCAT